jgi:hypothetical protein
MLSVSERSKLIEKIRQLPDKVEALVVDVPASELVMSYLPGEWSIAQNVHHLADAHMNAFFRFKRILIGGQPEIFHFDQKNWARTMEATTQDVEDSLMILHGLHRRWCHLMESIGEAEWDKYGIHDQAGMVTLEDVLLAYANHGDAHLKQIRDSLDVRARLRTG